MVEIQDKDITNATSAVLINCVVTFKMLKINKPLAIKCMQELVKRREAGEELDYENIIDQKLKEWQAKVVKPRSLKTPQDFAKLFAKDND